MPKLNEDTRLKRVAQTVQVLGMLMINPEMSQQAACDEVGIDPRTFRNWLHSGDNTIETLRGFLTMTQREMLTELSVARMQIVRLLIKDALDPLTPAKDRVTLERRLDEIANELQRIHHATPGVEEGANKFLKEGPLIEKQRSKLATVDVERTEEGVTLHVYEEQDVIDVTPSPSESDQSSHDERP